MGLLEWLVPQDKVFFDLFDQLSDVCVKESDLLVELMDEYKDVRNKCHKIKALEHDADDITHRIFERLNMTFITPIEPEEIRGLASALDDIIDYIDGTARMMMNYNISEPDAAMKELAKIISLSVRELDLAVKALRKMKHLEYVEERCIEVNRLENLADDVNADAVTEIFKGDNAMMAIKLKDIYQDLEIATDKCEDAANVLSDIATKHA